MILSGKDEYATPPNVTAFSPSLNGHGWNLDLEGGRCGRMSWADSDLLMNRLARSLLNLPSFQSN